MKSHIRFLFLESHVHNLRNRRDLSLTEAFQRTRQRSCLGPLNSER